MQMRNNNREEVLDVGMVNVPRPPCKPSDGFDYQSPGADLGGGCRGCAQLLKMT